MYIQATFKGKSNAYYTSGVSYFLWLTVGAYVTIQPAILSMDNDGTIGAEMRQYQTLKTFLEEWQLD
jgi:hypothetical protein